MHHLILFCLAWAFPVLQGAGSTQQPAGGQPTTDDSPSVVSASITLRDVDLGELFTKLKIDIGYTIGGRITVKASASVPIGDATTTKAYTIRGSVTSSELRLEGLRVRDLSADVLYENGNLKLTSLRGNLPPDVPSDPPGEFSGSATAGIEPRGDLTADLTLTRLPLGELFRSIPGGGLPISGTVTGKAEFRGPVEQLSDATTWVGSGELTAPALKVFDRAVRDAKVLISVRDGKARLTEAAAAVENIPVSGDGTLTLSDKYPFQATVKTSPKEVSELQKLVPELALSTRIQGKLRAEANASGALNPLTYSADGTVTADELSVEGVAADKVSVKWKVDPKQFTLSDLSAGVFSGTITGSAVVPLQDEAAGNFNVRFDKVDAAAVTKSVPQIPVKLTGRVTGDVTGQLPATAAGAERAMTAKVNLAADRLTVQGIPADELVGTLSLDGSAVRYELEGKTLGGSFDVKGRYPESGKTGDRREPPPADEEDGFINIRNIDLSRLATALDLRTVPLRGVFDFTFTHSPDFSNGSGRYSIRGLAVGGNRVVSELSGRIRLRNGVIDLGDTTGPLSSGSLRLKVRANLDQPARNFFRLDIDRANVSTLVGALGGQDDVIEGGVSLTARGKLWPEFRASGSVGFRRGRVSGLSVSDAVIPFSVNVRGSGGQVVIREAVANIGNGRLRGEFNYNWGASGLVDGDVRFSGVKIGSVLSDLNQTNYFGSTRASGRIRLKGEQVRSVDDLTGSVEMSLAQAAVRELPVLNEIAPFVPPTAVLKPFDSGELRAQLSRGVFRIQYLTLASPNADLYADGNVTLAGRLDLGVIVRTGQIGLNDTAVRQIGLQLPTYVGPLPLSLVRDLSAFLSNRTVRLTITGTVASPIPRVNAAAILSEEAIRFLLRRYLPTASADLSETRRR